MDWNKVLFVGAHTDDEMVCAGTLHRLAKAGSEVSVISASVAATESDRTGGRDSWGVVIPEWHRSMDLIGISNCDRQVYTEFLPSIDLAPFRQQIAQRLYDYCEMHQPTAAFILSPDDPNSGHALIGSVCEEVMRGRVPTVLRCGFPWNYRGFAPNLYVKLDATELGVKADVIRCYQSQKFRYHYLDMLMHYAKADGMSVKTYAVEKFELIRSVI